MRLLEPLNVGIVDDDVSNDLLLGHDDAIPHIL